MSDYFGKEVPKLGFGLMRLPRKLLSTDVEQVKAMVDRFMAAGFTYYDTAYLYPGSEAAIQKALVQRYPRDSFTLATKLNAMLAPTERAAAAPGHGAADCVGCRRCEGVCSQHLPITDHLGQAAELFSKA